MKKINLGPFKISHPFILAPMAGITTSPYRRFMKHMKSALVISDLISANGLYHAQEKTYKLLDFHEDERIIGIQIFGEDKDLLVNACKVVENTRADFVDLNLGCPVPKVVKKGAGSALCRDPIKLGKILKAMVDSVKIPVTIKIRTGWSKEEKNSPDVINAARDSGISWVAVHGRTRAQGYSGEADWDFIGNLKVKSSIPIIGNGDINTPLDAFTKFCDYGVDAVMIGRGALRNPFIFEMASSYFFNKKSFEFDEKKLIDLIDLQRIYLEDKYDKSKVLLHLRKFLSWYASGYPGVNLFRKKIFSTLDYNALWKETETFFLQNNGKRMDFLNQPFLMGGHG